jgi:hypothetical protein
VIADDCTSESLWPTIGLTDDQTSLVCTSSVPDPLDDQFAQDGAPIESAPFDVTSSVAALLSNVDIDGALRDQCGGQVGDALLVCDPDLKAPDGATPIVVSTHLAQPLDLTQLTAFGLVVRYDATTPGRAVIDGFPLLISQGGHVQYLSPVEKNGTYEVPVYADFRTNGGAFSNNMELIGPDWFAFVIFDAAQYERPWVCQVGVDRPTCDIPVAQPGTDWTDVATWLTTVNGE